MPRCSEAALETALRQLSEHAAGNRSRSNWMSTFLVAQRMKAAGYEYKIKGAELGVADLFVLIPDHSQGRSNPFVDLSSAYRWQLVKKSAQSTIWNNGTRNHPQTPLFNEATVKVKGVDVVQRHWYGELRDNAIDVLLDALGTDEPLPARDALAVLLTRDHDWTSEPTRDDLVTAAREYIGLDAGDLDRITSDTPLGLSVLGDPEWSPELLTASDLGPPAVEEDDDEADALDDISPESIQELPEQFRRFLGGYGIAGGGPEAIIDLLAATLSSQLVIMAGPSGSGKSLMASALSAFFAPAGRRRRLEGARLLAKPEEFFGYYSHLAGERFTAYEPLLSLLDMDTVSTEGDGGDGDTEPQPLTPPMVTIEEANLSPIEGYLSALVHRLGGLEHRVASIRLHTQPDAVDSQVPDLQVPGELNLAPYPRFFTTINVDADSPAPARKVVSRACVVLMETPTFETALAATDTLVHPSVEEADGPAATLLGRPMTAFDRYAATGSDAYQQAFGERATLLREALGADVVAHRQLQRSLMYMAWYVELAGNEAAEQGDPAVEAAADNAVLHFVLPSLPAAQFERALQALDDGSRSGVLSTRITRLRGMLAETQFGPPPDFWGALS